MSKYIDLYELMCPDDPVESDDPRREVIMQEMKQFIRDMASYRRALALPR